MFQTIANFFRVQEIRNKILFTFAMLVIYRIGTFVPVPGVNAEVLKLTDAQSSTGFLSVLNTFGGGALQNFSILAMGVMPYITSSIIVQLLQMDVVPKFAEWAKEGEVGRRKLSQVTRYGAIVLGFIEAIGMAYGFNNMFAGLIIDPGIGTYLLIALVLTAGTAFLMWLGEQITANGVGNGMSMIIFAGIVSTFPTTIQQIYETKFAEGTEDKLFINIMTVVGILLVVAIVVVAIIFIQEANRKIPVQYAKRVSGGSKNVGVGAHNTHLPLKINSAGVVPVIFAVSFIVTPATIASFFAQNDVTIWIKNNFDYSTPFGMTLYILLIIAFSYFYAFVQVNPEQISENLKKQGGYVPGIRPGKATHSYFSTVLGRITFVGAFFIAFIAVLPVIMVKIAGLPASAQIGGTSLLIVVGVALDTMKKLEGQLVKRHYKGFIK